MMAPVAAAPGGDLDQSAPSRYRARVTFCFLIPVTPWDLRQSSVASVPAVSDSAAGQSHARAVRDLGGVWVRATMRLPATPLPPSQSSPPLLDTTGASPWLSNWGFAHFGWRPGAVGNFLAPNTSVSPTLFFGEW